MRIKDAAQGIAVSVDGNGRYCYLDPYRGAMLAVAESARNVARAGRPGQPAEIAAVAAFLLGPDSSWLRGAEISPDGGMGAFATSDALGLATLRL